ncbi:MAG: hypothetical protein ACREVN_09305 [Gammaproteobacteria bacterium]
MHGCIAIFKNCKLLKMLAIRKSHFSDRKGEKAMDGFFNILLGCRRATFLPVAAEPAMGRIGD